MAIRKGPADQCETVLGNRRLQLLSRPFDIRVEGGRHASMAVALICRVSAVDLQQRTEGRVDPGERPVRVRIAADGRNRHAEQRIADLPSDAEPRIALT